MQEYVTGGAEKSWNKVWLPVTSIWNKVLSSHFDLSEPIIHRNQEENWGLGPPLVERRDTSRNERLGAVYDRGRESGYGIHRRT